MRRHVLLFVCCLLLSYLVEHELVRPQLQLRDAMRQQQYDINRQGMDIQSMRRSMSGVRQAAGMRPTGSGSMFMNYSHYYNFSRR